MLKMNNIDEETMKLIISRIKERRESLEMSFQNLADLTGMSKSTLQRYETGAIRNLPLSKVKTLASALKTTPAYLMGWEENKPAENDELDIENDKLFKNLPQEKKQQALEFLRFLQGK
jgi:transcriptional regulator with XRE-family HTH domain